jgi:hypothetical protein
VDDGAVVVDVLDSAVLVADIPAHGVREVHEMRNEATLGHAHAHAAPPRLPSVGGPSWQKDRAHTPAVFSI